MNLRDIKKAEPFKRWMAQVAAERVHRRMEAGRGDQGKPAGRYDQHELLPRDGRKAVRLANKKIPGQAGDDRGRVMHDRDWTRHDGESTGGSYSTVTISSMVLRWACRSVGLPPSAAGWPTASRP